LRARRTETPLRWSLVVIRMRRVAGSGLSFGGRLYIQAIGTWMLCLDPPPTRAGADRLRGDFIRTVARRTCGPSRPRAGSVAVKSSGRSRARVRAVPREWSGPSEVRILPGRLFRTDNHVRAPPAVGSCTRRWGASGLAYVGRLAEQASVSRRPVRLGGTRPMLLRREDGPRPAVTCHSPPPDR
jgi:hypothetical protein